MQDYYITDGLYGSFNCIMYDHAQPTTRPLRASAIAAGGSPADSPCGAAGTSSSWIVVDRSIEERPICNAGHATIPEELQLVEVQLPAAEQLAATVFGPSCDGLDVVFDR